MADVAACQAEQRGASDWQEDFKASSREHDEDALCATCGKVWGAHFGRCCDSEPSTRRFEHAAGVNPSDDPSNKPVTGA